MAVIWEATTLITGAALSSFWLWFPQPGQSACCWQPIPDFTIPMNPPAPLHKISCLISAGPLLLPQISKQPPHQEAWPCSRSKASSPERVQTGHCICRLRSGLWKSSHCRNGKSSAIAAPGQLSSTGMVFGFICQDFLSLKNNAAHWMSTF